MGKANVEYGVDDHESEKVSGYHSVNHSDERTSRLETSAKVEKIVANTYHDKNDDVVLHAWHASQAERNDYHHQYATQEETYTRGTHFKVLKEDLSAQE